MENPFKMVSFPWESMGYQKMTSETSIIIPTSSPRPVDLRSQPGPVASSVAKSTMEPPRFAWWYDNAAELPKAQMTSGQMGYAEVSPIGTTEHPKSNQFEIKQVMQE